MPFPEEWGRLGREGLVVRVAPDSGTPWIANCRPGLTQFSTARVHPDGRRGLLVAGGQYYIVDPANRALVQSGGGAITALWELDTPASVLFSHQDIYLERIGATGRLWYSRRLSWDGFQSIRFADDHVAGLGWNATKEAWEPFEVDLRTGQTLATAYDFPDDGREELAGQPPLAI